jgi:hypothetical protein
MSCSNFSLGSSRARAAGLEAPKAATKTTQLSVVLRIMKLAPDEDI